MENVVKQKNSFFQVVLKLLKQLGKFIVDDCIKLPAYILAHPLKGFEEFKRYKKGKMSVALLFVVLTIFVNILKFQYDGFLVNDNNIKDLNTVAQIAYVAGAVVVVTIGNWAVTTLFDGKGNMKEIFMMICYSFFPVMLIGFFNIILSNYVTKDESQFILILNIVAWSLTGYMALTGLIGIHEYGLGKMLWSVFTTIVATAIIVFIALLLFNLAEQIYAFFYSLYEEIATRYM